MRLKCGCCRCGKSEYKKRLEKITKELKELKERENKSIYMFGNKGGDFLNINLIGKGLVYLQVGHNCVSVIDSVVPIEFITWLISESMLCGVNVSYEEKAKSILDGADWPNEFIKELKAKIKSIDEYWEGIEKQEVKIEHTVTY